LIVCDCHERATAHFVGTPCRVRNVLGRVLVDAYASDLPSGCSTLTSP
jgi:hypothetical protein